MGTHLELLSWYKDYFKLKISETQQMAGKKAFLEHPIPD